MATKFEKNLNELIALLDGDEEALSAIEVLLPKVKNINVKKTAADLAGSNCTQNIPDELLNNAFAFAVFSDGACRGNPGPGAWGALGQNAQGDLLFESSGVDFSTTNNKMELSGAIYSLEKIIEYFEDNDLSLDTEVHLYSDSKYLIDGINSWVAGWKRRGWKKADGKTPENVDLWKRVDELTENLNQLKYHWVKGHAGHPQNERCDELANIALNEAGF